MEIYADVSPSLIFSSTGESCEVKNRLVLQIRNITNGDIELKNEKKIKKPDFKPIDEAAAIDGLSMIYIVFCLCGEGSLTTAEAFGRAELYCRDGYAVSKVGDDTLVLYPLETTQIEFNGSAELVIDGLTTEKNDGTLSFCRVKSFNINGRDSDGRTVIGVGRHPLEIPMFRISEGYEGPGFRDDVKFEWIALGADNCRFTPGDTALAAVGEGVSGEFTAKLLTATPFMLVASRNEDSVSKVCEIAPLEASIEGFTCTLENPGTPQAEAVLKFKIKNTRHAFIDRTGRIDVTPGENILKLPHTYPDVPYTLTVENQNGIISESRLPAK